MKTARQNSLLTLLYIAISSACAGSPEGTDEGEGPLSAIATWETIGADHRACRGRRCEVRPLEDTALADAGAVAPPAPEDGGAVAAEPDAGPTPDSGAALADAGPGAAEPPSSSTPCVRARRLWFEDFETGNYDRWTGRSYGDSWGNGCQSNRFDSTNARSGRRSHRSEIVCRSPDSVHRGYGGIQFDGERVLSSYTNRGVGLEAPYGVVNTYWSWLDTPYSFGGGRWFSFWTVNSSCDYSERVITLGLEDATRRITPAHIWDTGGRVTWSPGAPSFPLRRWVRTTLYLNYARGELHAWQDGVSVFHATFRRPTNDMCQWHWGAYASGDNTDIVLYEDDISIWKLEQPLTDFTVEPWFEGTTTACR